MTARCLWIGLDGVDLDMVRRLGPSRLPTLHRALAQGAHGPLQAVFPPATLPNWTSAMTGVNPGVHGVFDFTTRDGYRVNFTAGTVRESSTVFGRLDALGQSCCALFFPATWPPEPLRHGVFISGWDSPVAFEADASFVHPAGLHDALCARFGPIRFDDADEFRSDGADWHAALPAHLTKRIAHRLQIAAHLAQSKAWDLFAVYFGEADTACHHLWNFFDAQSPRSIADGHDRDGLPRVFEALDHAVETLVAAAGPDVRLLISSDHGSGGSSTKVWCINRTLAEHGLLKFSDGKAGRVTALRRFALERLPARLREQCFRAFAFALPGMLESRVRFGSIDMGATAAFSDELNYFPAVHLNIQGREPDGIVDPCDREAVIERVTQALLATRDPWTGAPVVHKVHRRETLYQGPLLARAPDLILELALDGDYSYNIIPSDSAGFVGPWGQLDRTQWSGKKGRSLAGSHRDHGIWLAHGPEVEARTEPRRMVDIAAILLGWAGASLEGVEGQPLQVRETPAVSAPPRPREPRSAAHRKGLATLEARLRTLGYLD